MSRTRDLTLIHYLQFSRHVFRLQFFQPATAIWRIPEILALKTHVRNKGRSLDLGCGDGRLAHLFLESSVSSEWTGMDYLFDEIRMASEQNVYHLLYCASAQALPEQSDVFTQVISNCVLEHIPDIESVISEVGRVLKPGGEFVFTVPHKKFHNFLPLARVLSILPNRSWRKKYCDHIDSRLAHYNYLDISEWRKLLQKYSMQISDSSFYFSKQEIFGWEILANLTGGVAYLLAGKKASPRMIQKRMGLLASRWEWVGGIEYLLLLPWLIICWLFHPAQNGACYLIKAIKKTY